MLGSKATDNRLIKECWNETQPGVSYIRSQSEKPDPSNFQESSYEDSKRSHALIQVPKNLNGPLTQKDGESSEKTTLINFPRNFSELRNLPVLGDDVEQGNLKLRKTISSESVGLEKLVAVSIGSQKTQPKIKQEPKWLPIQSLRKAKAMPRRASLPASYLENFLSVNNIRKRALSNTSIDSAEDGAVPMNVDGRLPSQNSTRKAKNACRRKVRPNSNEDNVVSGTEVVIETVLPAIEVHELVEKDSNTVEDDGCPKPTVSYISVTIHCARVSRLHYPAVIEAYESCIVASQIILLDSSVCTDCQLPFL